MVRLHLDSAGYGEQQDPLRFQTEFVVRVLSSFRIRCFTDVQLI